MDDEWISADEAHQIVARAVGVLGAAEAICTRAHHELVSAKALRLIWHRETRDDCAVPKEFWWAKGKAALEQDWTTGDFSTWLDQTYELRAFGVQFRKSDIMKMIPQGRPPQRGAIEAGDADEEWVSSSDARRLVYTISRINSVSAGDAILQYCRVGHIAGRAKHMKLIIKDRYQTRQEEESDCQIPDWFWEECTKPDSSVQDWPAGVMSGKCCVDGDSITARLTGVSFRRADLEIFKNQLNEGDPPVRAEAPSSKGGKPPAAWWDALWVEICRQLYVGELHPKAQVDVETAMHDWLATIGETAAESTIRERARKLWDAINA